jgi:hypothetical protein
MEAGYASSEVISCIHAYLDSSKPQKKTLTAWSHSCGRQNKKQNYAITWYVGSKHFLKQKLSLPGHSFLDNDRL